MAEDIEVRKSSRRPFRILSLDGGGIKGVFSAAVLSEFEKHSGRKAADCFDLIAGTSTGGILAIGLGLGFDASLLLQFYRERGAVIFPSTSRKRRIGLLRQLFGPKHSHEVLRTEIKSVLGERLFAESRCPLVIPTYDAVGGRIYIMKTPHNPRFISEQQALAVDVALATSAAPTYFAAARFPTQDNASYVDGGVWANCPSLVALTEAIKFFNQAPGDVDILSIGTTSSPFNIYKQRNAGAMRWNVGIIDLMFEAQVEAARAHASLLAGGFHRVDATVVPREFDLDNASPESLEKLSVLGGAIARQRTHFELLGNRFFS